MLCTSTTVCAPLVFYVDVCDKGKSNTKILYNEPMFRKLRLVLAVLLLLLSVSLLIWASLPILTESRVLPILPADLQLPTPGAFIYYWVV